MAGIARDRLVIIKNLYAKEIVTGVTHMTLHQNKLENEETLKFQSSQSKAQTIFDRFGSDRGFKAIEDYCDHLINIDDLEKRIANIESDLCDSAPRKNWRFDQYIKVAADDITKLRRQDVYRVVELACSKDGIAKYLKMHRPDLTEEIDEVMVEFTHTN